jgi:hypothetical protein
MTTELFQWCALALLAANFFALTSIASNTKWVDLRLEAIMNNTNGLRA